MTHPSLKSLKGYHRVNNTRLFKWRGPKIGGRHESVVVKTTTADDNVTQGSEDGAAKIWYKDTWARKRMARVNGSRQIPTYAVVCFTSEGRRLEIRSSAFQTNVILLTFFWNLFCSLQALGSRIEFDSQLNH